MQKGIRAVLGYGVLAVLGGCTYLRAAESVHGRAFIVRNEVFSSSFWNCDATSGEPVCYEANKVPLGKVAPAEPAPVAKNEAKNEDPNGDDTGASSSGASKSKPKRMSRR